MTENPNLYAIALGSNRLHGRHGRPPQVIAAAIVTLDSEFDLFDASSILINPAHGGAGREFANAVVLVSSNLAPQAMLGRLKAIEQRFGRRPGRRWGARVLDLDIVAWSGPPVRSRCLTIPHPRTAERAFVLQPLLAIAPRWRIAGPLTARHLAQRLARRPSRR
ncbi:2-amino-4-hydroxy-6-hydroxymethyldihydropteridine diphosphokinase [Sphingomonas sp. GCM10030256]|uniref:2-amino-4-hydroxy-6- hydroxymethyldihydropteridine diphosphokinase n=1 Tax=Sphingomonas sp. GCM10030256 TaxID=3273427 RepID=UPI00361C2BA0